MDFSTMSDAIAEVAHRCWCKQMIDDGWRCGEVTDLDARVHSALRPYAQLPAGDRAQLRVCVESTDMEESLVRSIETELRERTLSAVDLRVGMPVRMIGDTTGDIGVIQSLHTHPKDPDLLNLVVVRWPSGEVVEYCPAEHAVVPAE